MALASGAAESLAINAVAAAATYVNLCSTTPGTTGAAELSSTRQSVTWSTSTAGSAASNTGTETIAIAASTTAGYFGTWTAVTSGTYEIGGALSPSITTGTSAGSVVISSGSLTLTAS